MNDQTKHYQQLIHGRRYQIQWPWHIWRYPWCFEDINQGVELMDDKPSPMMVSEMSVI